MEPILVTHGLDAEARRHLTQKLVGRRVVRLDRSGECEECVSTAEILLWCAWNNASLVRTLEIAPRLKWVHACTAGTDQLWLEELRTRGIAVTRSPSAAATPVAEWVMAAILMSAKRLAYFEEMQNQRRWGDAQPNELMGQTVGVVGTGAIGTAVALRAAGFGMKTVGVRRRNGAIAEFDRIVKVGELNSVISGFDYLVLACPLTTETKGLISARELTNMKQSAFLVNVARGPILIESHLVEAVLRGEIAGAFLDVFDAEPLDPASVLWRTPGIRISPHAAWRSRNSHRRAIDDFLVNLGRFDEGLPLVDVSESPVHNREPTTRTIR